MITMTTRLQVLNASVAAMPTSPLAVRANALALAPRSFRTGGEVCLEQPHAVLGLTPVVAPAAGDLMGVGADVRPAAERIRTSRIAMAGGVLSRTGDGTYLTDDDFDSKQLPHRTGTRARRRQAA